MTRQLLPPPPPPPLSRSRHLYLFVPRCTPGLLLPSSERRPEVLKKVRLKQGGDRRARRTVKWTNNPKMNCSRVLFCKIREPKVIKKTAPPRDVETLRRVWEMCSQGEKMHPWLNNIIFFVLKNAEVTKVPTLLIWIWKHIATQFREMKFRCFVPFKKRRAHTQFKTSSACVW